MKNKKLIATVASLCLVLVAVVAAVVGVLAAAQQNFTGNVRVKYQANDVSAVVGLQKKAETDADYSGLTEGTTQKTFAKTDGQWGSSETGYTEAVVLTLAEETLTSRNKYVVYKFSFINTNTSYGMTVTPTYTPATSGEHITENVTVRFQLKAKTETPTLPLYQSEGVSNTSSLGNETPSSFNVSASGEQDLYLIVAITDINADAYYKLGGSGENSISFNLVRQSA